MLKYGVYLQPYGVLHETAAQATATTMRIGNHSWGPEFKTITMDVKVTMLDKKMTDSFDNS